MQPRRETEAAEPEPEEQILAEIKGRLPLPNGTPRAIKTRTENAKKKSQPGEAEAKTEGEEVVPCADKQPRCRAGSPGGRSGRRKRTAKSPKAQSAAATNRPPTRRPSNSMIYCSPKAPGTQARLKTRTPLPKWRTLRQRQRRRPQRLPRLILKPWLHAVTGIESDVDPETWAEYGGWYRQDYTIYYRPTGHKDKFIQSWLVLTGPQAPKGGTSPAAAVFDYLTSKDAQGSCTKCHSVDDVRGKARRGQFLPCLGREQTGALHEFHP